MKANKSLNNLLKALVQDNFVVPVGDHSRMPVVDQILDVGEEQIEHLHDLEIVKNAKDMVCLDDNPNNRAFIEGLDGGEEAWFTTCLGKKGCATLRAACKRMKIKINMWRATSTKEGLSSSQKSAINTRRHGIVDTSVTYKMEDQGQVRYAYDGDFDLDPQRGAGEQDAPGFILPYVRNKEGEVVMAGDYKKMHLYVTRILPVPPKTELVFLQDLLAKFVGQPQFWALLKIFRTYRQMMQDRSPEIKTVRNGFRHVYYVQFKDFFVFSPITFNELTDELKQEVTDRNNLRKEAVALLETAGSLNGGQEFQDFKDRFVAFLGNVRRLEAWYLWKQFVAPHLWMLADDVTADDLGI